MKVRIKARNVTAHRQPFAAWAFHRDALKTGRTVQEARVTFLETEGGDPGQEIQIDFDWPAPGLPPYQLVWKAPPERSCKWEILEFSVDGRPIHTPGLFA